MLKCNRNNTIRDSYCVQGNKQSFVFPLLGDHYVSLNGYFFGRGLYKRIFIFIILETRLSSALCFSTIEGENYICECLFIEKKGATRVIKYKVHSYGSA
jgi:hypothetical protein